MKQLVYHIIVCGMAVLFLTACEKDDDISGRSMEKNGNSIILNLSSETLPVSRAGNEPGVEMAVNHIDVVIFEENGDWKWHERVEGSETGNGKITLTAKRSSFNKDTKYWVYLIANSTALAEIFDAKDFDLNRLKAMTQSDRNIHMTGLSQVSGAPRTFLMDGVAYAGTDEPNAPETVTLNYGTATDNTELQVTLRRAAAKIVVRIQKGDRVTFDDSKEAHNAGYYLRNMPYTTSVIADVNGTADLTDTDKSSGSYFNWTADLITVTAYTYAHTWINESALEKEVRLVVNIPMKYEGDGDDAQLRESNWYQIPVSEKKALERNTCYEVVVSVNAPGANDPSKPVELTDMTYSVQDWNEQTILVGGEDDRPVYLTLNENEIEMHNMADDNTTLRFASSSEVHAEVVSAYYYDKFGVQRSVDAQTLRQITITPEPDVTGNIGIHSPVPTNNTIRYIKVKVFNDDQVEREVEIIQYPLEYIINIQSRYSYRDDFKTNNTRPTTYEYMGDRIYGISLATGNISSWNGQYDYEASERSGWWGETNTSSGFFRSKFVSSVTNGKSTILHYYWNSREQRETSSTGEYNGRLYHIRLTATSNKYTVGRPRLIEDESNPGLMVTDPGKDNAQLVSPSFMIASSLGGFMLGAGNLTLDDSDKSLRVAREHCANYVEVAEDGTVYDDWRLPTEAELKIIMDFQGTQRHSKVCFELLKTFGVTLQRPCPTGLVASPKSGSPCSNLTIVCAIPLLPHVPLNPFYMNTERKRGGRIPKLNPKSHHVMLRFDDDEWMKFLVMYEQTDVKAKAVFAKARIFGEPFKVLREDKTLVEYYTKLSSFHSQYRMIGNNYNQVVKELRCHFSEKKAMALLYKLKNCTRELVSLTRDIVELTRKFEERWSQR